MMTTPSGSERRGAAMCDNKGKSLENGKDETQTQAGTPPTNSTDFLRKRTNISNAFFINTYPILSHKKIAIFFGKKSGLRQFFPCLEACFKDWSQAQAVFSSLLVCGDNSLTYIIFVIFSPHGTFLATIFSTKKARKSRQNRFCDKTA